MKSVGEIMKEQNIHLDTADPVSRGGFTQVPNFILKDPELSIGAKVAYAMFLSYAWHNDSCFPGQDRLAHDMGMTRPRVTQLIAELETAGLVTVQRRGQGKTNVYTIHFQVRRPVPNRVLPEVNRFTSRSKLAYLRR
ncbi:MAG: helix-turn-helix domain-containing protein [Verrucomicrobia bacterium]|nr:helix-turn-helix domain-containing protein [Verrucomicrobiota bacterium]